MSGSTVLWSIHTPTEILKLARQVVKENDLSVRSLFSYIVVDGEKKEGPNVCLVGTIREHRLSLFGISAVRMRVDLTHGRNMFDDKAKTVEISSAVFAVRDGTNLKKIAPLIVYLRECMSQRHAEDCVAPFQAREPA